MTNQPDREQQLIDKICQTLDNATESFDGQTLSKLTRARTRALQEKVRPLSPFPVWQTGAIMAAAAFLIVMTAPQKESTESISITDSLESLDMITDQEGLEFYRELEFYDWLSREEDHAG